MLFMRLDIGRPDKDVKIYTTRDGHIELFVAEGSVLLTVQEAHDLSAFLDIAATSAQMQKEI